MFRLTIALLGAVRLCTRRTWGDPTTEAQIHKPSLFYSAEDGWVDVSGFLDEKYGYLPIGI